MNKRLNKFKINLAATNSKKSMHIIQKTLFPEFHTQKLEMHVIHN